MVRRKLISDEQVENLKRAEALLITLGLIPVARTPQEVVARPARRGRRWYWSALWPEPLPVRRWRTFIPLRTELHNKRFEWGHWINRTFVTNENRVAFAHSRHQLVLMLSYDYLRAMAGRRPLGDLETAVPLAREEFAAVWDVLLVRERDEVGLPDLDRYVAAQALYEVGEQEAGGYLSELMTHRPSLEKL